MRGYKVFNPDWSCHGKQYSCHGIFKQKGELKLGKNGIHFCKRLIDCFNYYKFNPGNKVAEIEAVGKIVEDEYGERCCTSKIKILRELSWNEVLDLVNTGNENTGFENTGDFNSGKFNSGSCNSGNCNSGNHNSGNCNSGHRNSGNRNSGYCNSGYYNSGNNNIGNYNSGNYNVGDYNTGDFNAGNRSTGCFNTEENKINFFNKPSDWTYEDWEESKAKEVLDRIELKYLWIPNYRMTKYKTEDKKKKELCPSKQSRWENLSKEDKKAVLSLPNFNADIFKEITGIDVTIDKKVVLTKE